MNTYECCKIPIRLMAEIRRSPVEVTVACLIIFSVLHIAGGCLGFLPVWFCWNHPVFAASFSSWIYLSFVRTPSLKVSWGVVMKAAWLTSFRGKTDSSIKRYMEERLNRKDGSESRELQPHWVQHSGKKKPSTSWKKQDDLRNPCFWVTVCSAFQTAMKTPTPIQKKTSTARE